jgi:hypothetical protein
VLLESLRQKHSTCPAAVLSRDVGTAASQRFRAIGPRVMMPRTTLAEDKLGACTHAPPAYQPNVGRPVVVEHQSAEPEHRVLSLLRSAPGCRCDSMNCSPCRPVHPHGLSSLDLILCCFGGGREDGDTRGEESSAALR